MVSQCSQESTHRPDPHFTSTRHLSGSLGMGRGGQYLLQIGSCRRLEIQSCQAFDCGTGAGEAMQQPVASVTVSATQSWSNTQATGSGAPGSTQ